MTQPMPLPMGRAEFEEWSDRIISGAIIQGAEGLIVPGGTGDDVRSLKFALASMIMHLGPCESHKPDAYFIHALRKGACNQVAHAVIMEYKTEQKAKEDALKAEMAAPEDAHAVEREAHLVQ